jgi:hypothetical protein
MHYSRLIVTTVTRLGNMHLPYSGPIWPVLSRTDVQYCVENATPLSRAELSTIGGDSILQYNILGRRRLVSASRSARDPRRTSFKEYAWDVGYKYATLSSHHCHSRRFAPNLNLLL